MILEWLGAAPVILVAVLVVFLPGMLPLLIIGFRGLALAALSPVVGVTIAAGSAILLDIVGLPFVPLSYAAVLLAVSLIAAGLRRVCGAVPRRSNTHTRGWLLPAAVMIGVVLSTWSLTAYIGAPDGISQTNDAIFHLNAVRYALETGSASSVNIASFTGSSGFYPAAWHALVVTTIQISGGSLPVAINALTIVIGAVIWPLGVAWLAQIATDRATIAGYAVVLAGALQAFPLLMFQWGVLYPNALSIALLPAAVALVLSAPRWAASTRRVPGAVLLTLLFGIAFAALLLSQPSTALIWGMVCATWLTFWMFGNHFPSKVRFCTVAVVWLALGGLWLLFASSTSGSHWPTFRGKLEAAIDVLSNRQMEIPTTYVLSGLMAAGIIAAIRHRGWRWMPAVWLLLSGLYIAVAAVGSPVVRTWVLGPWYSDPNRISALAPVIVIPLAAIGVDALVRAAHALISRGDQRGTQNRGGASWIGLVAVVLLATTVIGTRSPAMPSFTEDAFYPNSRYAISQTTFLSIDERALLESLPDHVESGARIIGNPSTGIGFGYALAGVDVFPRTWAQPTTDAWRTISDGLREVATDPNICDALATLGEPRYVLDFGAGEAEPGRYILPAMTKFEGVNGFELVTRVGDASLWRITACGTS